MMKDKEKLVAQYLKLRGSALHNVATATRSNSGEAYDSEKFRYLSDKYSSMAADRFEEIANEFRNRKNAK